MDILNEFDNGGLHFRHAADDSADQAGYSFHVHDQCEIFYFISGKAQYLVEGSVYPLENGTLLIMRPGEAHCIQFLGSGRYERYAVNFPVSLFDSFDPERRLMQPFLDRPLGRGNSYQLSGLEGIFRSMAEGKGDYETHLRLCTALLRLVCIIRDEYSGREKEAPRQQTLSESIVAYVNGHLFGKLSIDSLAEQFFISSSQLRRVFRQSTGATLWEYVTAKRLAAARVMLSNGTPAGETALQCGFGDYSSFYRAYVKRYGESPSDTAG